MASYYTYEFTDEKNYRVVEHFPWGESRVVPTDSHDLAAWIAKGNIPEKVSGDRFVSIVKGEPVVDPEKSETLKRERWGVVRSTRNRLLQESDWTQLPDVPMQKDQYEAWKKYRQMLRDIPQISTKPDDVRWPEIPA